MTQDSPTDNWLKWWQSAVEESMKLNGDFLQTAWQQYMDFLNPSAAQPEAYASHQAASPTATSSSIWTDMMQQYVQLNTAVAEQYMDAYRTWWGSARPATEVTPAADAAPRTVAPLELKLNGFIGRKLSTAFSLTNDGSAAQSGLFMFSPFFHAETGQAVDLHLKLHPAMVNIAPGQSEEIQLNLTIPRKFEPGSYRARMVIQGLQDASFHLLLEVKAPAPTNRAKKKK